MNKLSKLLNKKKLLIFDLDGVLIDSKSNMRESWNYTVKKNNLNIPFKNYFKFIGLPFKNILVKLKINSRIFKFEKIKKDFAKQSLKNIHKIKPYKNARHVLQIIKKRGKFIALLTSKDYHRSKKIIKNLKFNFDHIECGSPQKKGKPHPYQLMLILKKLKIKKQDAVYIGDMYPDLQTAKNARIDFIFAKYGYGKFKINNISNRINSITNLIS